MPGKRLVRVGREWRGEEQRKDGGGDEEEEDHE